MNGFMIQGGGFDTDMKQKTTQAPIANEGKKSTLNKLGTLAMARTSDPQFSDRAIFILCSR